MQHKFRRDKEKKEDDIEVNAYLLFLILILLILSENVLTIIAKTFGKHKTQKNKKGGRK